MAGFGKAIVVSRPGSPAPPGVIGWPTLLPRSKSRSASLTGAGGVSLCACPHKFTSTGPTGAAPPPPRPSVRVGPAWQTYLPGKPVGRRLA